MATAERLVDLSNVRTLLAEVMDGRELLARSVGRGRTAPAAPTAAAGPAATSGGGGGGAVEHMLEGQGLRSILPGGGGGAAA